MELTRRQLLKVMSAAGVGAAVPFGLSKMVFAAEPSDAPLLVVIHMRGGCDGLHFISPSTDPDFIAARSSDLRVLSDGADPGYALANQPDPKIDFRLHNAAGGLAELYKSGDLAFIHACGLTDSTRSHFVATDMIEHGVGTGRALAEVDTGWIARAFASHDQELSKVPAIALATNTSGDLSGLNDALAVPSLNGGLGYIGGPSISSVIWSMYANLDGPLGTAGRNALVLPALIDQALMRDAAGHLVPYQPSSGVSYDQAGSLQNPLKTAAQLIKMDVGLKALTIDYGNWDTHEYQGGRFKALVQPLSNGISAFWNDISAFHQRVVVVTVTEFGRRLRSNKSGGTDHGRAGVMAILGGGLQGGKFYGKWPGLASAQLDEGVDLAVTTDYRTVLSEIIARVHGNETGAFPGFTNAKPLGLF